MKIIWEGENGRAIQVRSEPFGTNLVGVSRNNKRPDTILIDINELLVEIEHIDSNTAAFEMFRRYLQQLQCALKK